MKQILKISIVLILLCWIGNTYAQKTTKIGHVNSNDLLEKMPGIDSAEAKLKVVASNIEKQFEMMKTEYNTKLETYMSSEEKMSDLEKEIAADELQGLQGRIEKFRTKAQENLEAQREKIYKPILDKAQNAINEVAKENGFNYIFDTGYGILLYYETGEDVMPLVLKKLGIE